MTICEINRKAAGLLDLCRGFITAYENFCPVSEFIRSYDIRPYIGGTHKSTGRIIRPIGQIMPAPKNGRLIIVKNQERGVGGACLRPLLWQCQDDSIYSG